MATRSTAAAAAPAPAAALAGGATTPPAFGPPPASSRGPPGGPPRRPPRRRRRDIFSPPAKFFGEVRRRSRPRLGPSVRLPSEPKSLPRRIGPLAERSRDAKATDPCGVPAAWRTPHDRAGDRPVLR